MRVDDLTARPCMLFAHCAAQEGRETSSADVVFVLLCKSLSMFAAIAYGHAGHIVGDGLQIFVDSLERDAYTPPPSLIECLAMEEPIEKTSHCVIPLGLILPQRYQKPRVVFPVFPTFHKVYGWRAAGDAATQQASGLTKTPSRAQPAVVASLALSSR